RLLILAGKLSGAEAASVILHDPIRNDLYFAAATGPAADALRKIRIPPGEGIAGTVFATSQPKLENRVTDHYKAVDDKTSFDTKSLLCVPLSFGGKNLGVLQILNKAGGQEPFTEADVDLACRLAAQAAIAIRNAELFDRVIASSGLYGAPSACADLKQRLIAGNAAATTERVSVLFVDMRGFTQLCHLIGSPDRIHARLGEFLGILIDKIYAAEGIVNKVLGDGVMGIFRHETSAMRALRCSVDMVSAFGELHERWTEQENADLDFLDIGVGIATDDVILGATGNERLRDFTVMGTAVNLAAALEFEARGGRHVLCDNHTFAAAKDVILSSEPPQRFNIARPNQVVTHWYRIHQINSLRIKHDDNVEEIKAIRGQQRQPRIFVSYSDKDRDLVDERIVKPLEAARYNVFFAARTLEGGQSWSDEISQALREADRVVVVVSANAVQSRGVRDEVRFALTLQSSDAAATRIYPVRLDESKPSDIDYRLASLQYRNLDSDDAVAQFMRDLEALVSVT
ncbi:MAG: TIR domain-containing protein, partial [Candidatus Eremiobacteraeota bacterium]|nr:TIR domain-containing protein [Candidatus Eremiobacteraeota bacterium]